MALTTLPYPSMDFVPLDILTAEEMNQLVANIEAINNATIGTNQIADNAITTAKLNDSAVTSSKIDWTTLNGNGSITLGDTLIQWGRGSFGNQSFTNDWWGTLRRSQSQQLQFTYPIAFSARPVCLVMAQGSPIIGFVSNNDGDATKSPQLIAITGQAATGTYPVDYRWIAIGSKT